VPKSAGRRKIVKTKDLIWYDVGVLIGTAVKAVASVRRLVSRPRLEENS
jgi:hypothetical protein